MMWSALSPLPMNLATIDSTALSHLMAMFLGRGDFFLPPVSVSSYEVGANL